MAREYYTYPIHGETVSVIIPAYNVASTIDRALDSIQSQTLKSLEIICIDDGSTDSTLERIQAHASIDDRIKVVSKPNEGYGKSCNIGIDKATGKWISIVEADDWVLPRFYETLTRCARNEGGRVDVVKSPYFRVIEDEAQDEDEWELIECNYAPQLRRLHGTFQIQDASFLLEHHPSIWSAIYRRDFLNEKGIRFHEIPGAGWADNPFLFDTLLKADRIASCPESFYCYVEDSQEKQRELYRDNYRLAFDRWHDMANIVDSDDSVDESVKRALYRRGFAVIGSALAATTSEDESLAKQINRVFQRMSPKMVLHDGAIPPSLVSKFAKAIGANTATTQKISHAAFLGGEAAKRIKNEGPKEFLNSAKRYLARS